VNAYFFLWQFGVHSIDQFNPDKTCFQNSEDILHEKNKCSMASAVSWQKVQLSQIDKVFRLYRQYNSIFCIETPQSTIPKLNGKVKSKLYPRADLWNCQKLVLGWCSTLPSFCSLVTVPLKNSFILSQEFTFVSGF